MMTFLDVYLQIHLLPFVLSSLLLGVMQLGAVIALADGNELIPLSQVPRLPFMPRPRRGRKMAASTIFRWAQRGVRGVRLEVVRVGGTLCTTVQALQHFFEHTAGGVGTVTPQPAKQREQELARVKRELDANGL